MTYAWEYDSPLGKILLSSDEAFLTGLWFEGQKHFARSMDKHSQHELTSPVNEAVRWLDVYFAGRQPDFTPPIKLCGTDFQKEIWELIAAIPYAQTAAYASLAGAVAARRGIARFSAQAVGGAVARNPISIIIPCHRVLGSDGSLTGYAGGIERKAALLSLEKNGKLKAML